MLKNTKDYQQHLMEVLSSNRFLNKQGLGNELPFFIFPYPPKEELEVRSIIAKLIKKLSDKSINILHIDLYELAIEIIKSRGIWEQIIEREEKISKEELKELLQGVLDTEHHLIPTIKNKIDSAEFKILFISGIGEVFPYIRSHNVLNNLQSTAKEQPTLMFFPGGYEHSLEDGASLQLFSLLQDDKYYRAFNIFHYEV